jgi:transposase InsO family protein
MKFAFIHAEKASFPVAALCRLFGVSRQGYYTYAARPKAEHRAREIALRQELKALHVQSRGTYGSPRMLAALRAKGLRIGKRRVERTMRSLGLNVHPARRFRRTTWADPAHRVEPNVLDRRFCASRPNERWVTDISYVWTAEGWCYLAAIIDLFSRTVVGWALSTSLATDLPLEALRMAIQRRRPHEQLLHHSDRGCQYTSDDYRVALRDLGIEVSMSRKGNCWDNAVAESFFSTLKKELIYPRHWASRMELRAAVFEYIEVFYNRQRIHSTLDYKTPAQFEIDHVRAQAA